MAFTLPKATNTEFSAIPVGLYVVRLKAMEEQEPQASQFSDEPKASVKWIFTIEQVIDANDEDEAEAKVGEEVWVFSSITMGKKAKMRAFAEALLGRAIDEKESITDEMLIGKRAKASIIPHTKTDGSETTKIGSLVPYKQRNSEPF